MRGLALRQWVSFIESGRGLDWTGARSTHATEPSEQPGAQAQRAHAARVARAAKWAFRWAGVGEHCLSAAGGTRSACTPNSRAATTYSLRPSFLVPQVLLYGTRTKRLTNKTPDEDDDDDNEATGDRPSITLVSEAKDVIHSFISERLAAGSEHATLEFGHKTKTSLAAGI